VLALPETRIWRKTHSFPVSVVPAVDAKRALENGCFWSVAVYAARPERLELWHIFFVEVGGDRILVSDVNGKEVPLSQWRKEER
jgi:hypothetical protein